MEGKKGDNAAHQGDAFDFDEFVAFQRKLETTPDVVTDEEIIEAYGDGFSPAELRDLFSRHTFNRPSKHPRASARGKLRRRLAMLDRALEQVTTAVQEVLDAPGRTNKRAQLDTLLSAIEQFRQSVLLPQSDVPDEIDLDFFDRILNMPERDWNLHPSDAEDGEGAP